MKTKYLFEIMDLDDEMIAVPVGKGAENFHGVIKVNETAATILKLLEQETTEEAVLDSLMEQYSGDRIEIADYVHDYIEKLRKEGLVE